MNKNTFLFLAFFSLVNSLSAWAEFENSQWKFSGHYMFTGATELELALQYEVVYTYTEQGHKHLEQLRANGFTCELRMSNAWLCKRFAHEITVIPDGVLNKIMQQHLNKLEVIVGQTQGSAELVAKGQSYVEWLIDQKLTVNGQIFEKYTYAILDGNLEKLKVGSFANGNFNEFVALKPYELSHFVLERQSQSMQVWTEYLIRLVLPQKQ